MKSSASQTTPVSAEQLGYCSHCGDNSIQHRGLRSPWLQTINRVTGGLLSRMGFGSWKCAQCGTQFWFFEPPSEMVGPDPLAEVDPSVMQSGGNFIRQEQDLVAIAARLERFSEKFRESILDRLFAGQIGMRTLREDLNISEVDLLAMVRERVNRLELRIEQLNAALNRTVADKIYLAVEAEHEAEKDYLMAEVDSPIEFQRPPRNSK